MFLLTVAVFISNVPVVVFYIVVIEIFPPIFQANSVFRWPEIFLQINSLVNPALYFYRNNRYRKAALKLLRLGKPQEIRPVVRVEHRARRHRDSVASIDVGEVVDSERAPRLRRSQSYAAETHGHRNTGCGVSADRVMDRRMSAPSLTSHGNLRDAEQYVTLTVTVPIEDAVKISNDGNDNKKSHRLKMTRSKSLKHRDSVASIDVGEVVDSERASRLRRSQSYAPAYPGGGVLDQWLGIGVPLRVSNPDPV